MTQRFRLHLPRIYYAHAERELVASRNRSSPFTRPVDYLPAIYLIGSRLLTERVRAIPISSLTLLHLHTGGANSLIPRALYYYRRDA